MNTHMPVVISALIGAWIYAQGGPVALVWGLGYAAGAWVSHRIDRKPK